MSRILALLLVVSISISLKLDDTVYYKSSALPGDGVFSFLRRYDLDRYSCNHEQFYRINKMKDGDGLKVGKSYNLPIKIYKFNGKTIRSSIGINDWGTAKNIETYNDDMLKNGYREKSFRDDKQLWVPFHFLNCPDEDLPVPQVVPENGEINATNSSVASGRTFPIFGKKYQYVPLASSLLKGKVYYIESGHGGPDPGAMTKVGNHNLCEDEYAYDVAIRLVRLLVANGATAYMITRDKNDGIRDDSFLDCDTDEVVWGNDPILVRHKPRLFQRSDVINTLYEKHKKQGVKEQKLVVIHVDSRGKREQTDLFFYYHPDEPEGKKIANALYNSVKKNYEKIRSNRSYSGTVTARDLHMLRETKVPSAYIELGNIRHPQDQQRIMLSTNRQLLADWMYEGLK